MRLQIYATTAVLLTLAFGGGSLAAAPCKDAKGKFIKCPPIAAAPAARCRNAKGAFAKCGTPGAKPV
jgi:hypothetical protein